MNKSDNVWMTGMAWVTALGDDLDAVWARLLARETGMREVSYSGQIRNLLAAPVVSVPMEVVPAERVQRMALDAAQRALRMSGRSTGDGVVLIAGTSFGSYIEDDPPAVTAHAWADRLGDSLGIGVPPVVVSTACSAGSDAILIGSELIRGGVARCCLCGGVDVLTWAKRTAHSALQTMSPTQLRAFDVRHDGTLLGEGAAFVVLEAPGCAAPPLAMLRGNGSSSDATGMTAPDTSGTALRMAMEHSLADSGLAPTDIGVINAHGSGTSLNDLTEREAFSAVFHGTPRPVVFGTKGNFGHSLGATGAIEAVATVLALRHRMAPPVFGLEQPDPDFTLPLPVGEALEVRSRFGMSVTLGFGGFDTSLIFEACT